MGFKVVDLSNKTFETNDDKESEKLLRIAVAQGYSLPKGLMALVGNRCFHFVGFPYKAVSTCEKAENDNLIMFSDMFGNENEELREILKNATRFCKAHGYNALRIYADENENEYTGNAFVRNEMGSSVKSEYILPKPKKVTLEDIEKRFGCPVEIVP